MQLVQERKQILAAERNLPPHPLPAHFPIHRIKRYLVEIQIESFAVAGSRRGPTPKPRLCPGSTASGTHVISQPGISSFQLFGKHQRGDGNAFALRFEQLRVEPLVQFMVPGDDAPVSPEMKRKTARKRPAQRCIRTRKLRPIRCLVALWPFAFPALRQHRIFRVPWLYLYLKMCREAQTPAIKPVRPSLPGYHKSGIRSPCV